MNIFKKKLNVLVLGSDGMLGYDVYNELLKKSYSQESKINKVIGLGKCDIEKYFMAHDYIDTFYFFSTHEHFDYVINCVAMTDTNAAETTKEGRDLSYKLNVIFPQKLAEACKYFKTKLIHISTDYVFSENSVGYLHGFYVGLAEPFPVNVYGTHKLLGEIYIKNMMEPKTYVILRTSWLYGEHNKKSFVHKFITNAYKCMEENRNIEVTENEYSVPTSTQVVVDYITKVLYNNDYGINGIIHAVNDSEKAVSRLVFAKKIAKIYNEIINEYKLEIKLIDRDKIIGVKRENKLQPTNSYMRTQDKYRVFYWDVDLKIFLKKLLIENTKES
jgi:dTDP-4-dehydrorhamnose reductase